MKHTEPLRLRFDAFELDERDARLLRDGEPVALAPKAFAVLCTLAREPGALVTKDELLDAVWGHRHVSESVLKTTISELRAALSDDARQPRYIETASRRGYRFIGTLATPAPQSASPNAQGQTIIGRRSALQRMHAAWEEALGGRRQLVWLAGEAGIGKTTLVDAFVSELNGTVHAHGQCVEQYGAGEPYLPVLEALSSLCTNDRALVAMMRKVAPTWLLQLPWLVDDAEREALRHELAGINPDRMLRELGELIDQYTLRQPLLLVTEDLHWSDDGTVRLIDHIARRRRPARLMWLSTFRVAELVSGEHALKSVRHELRMHRLADEIVLDPFSELEVADYIDARFPGSGVSEAFVRRLHRHTDGLPLFLVNVIDDLASADGMDAQPGQLDSIPPWQVPENLAGVMEKQIARLPPQLQTLLEAASVCGVEFRSQIVAEVLGQDAHSAAEACDDLTRQQQWIAHVATGGLPDGSLSGRYTFRHALYRHVFYQRVGAVKRAQLHRRVAHCLEQARAGGLVVTAAELASHFDLGHDPLAALRHYNDAVDNALARFAQVEAVSLSARGADLLRNCPQNAERFALELNLQLKRGVACAQLLGMASAETKQAFERAQALCDLLPDTPALGWALNGLGLVRYGSANYDATHALGERIYALSTRSPDPGLRISGCNLMGMASAGRGEFEHSLRWLREGVAAYDALPAPLPPDRFFIDIGVSMQCHVGLYLLPVGRFDEARRQVEAARSRARALGQPMAIALSIRSHCMLEMWMGHPERVPPLAAELEKVAIDHGITYATAMSQLLGGWALAHLGDAVEGHARIVEGYRTFQRLSVASVATQILSYAADAALLAHDLEAAQSHIDEALQIAGRAGERLRLASLLLGRARLALARGEAAAADASMREALSVARSQQALGLELNALMALCEVAEPMTEDRTALQAALSRLTEGHDTALVQRARALTA